MNFDHRRVPDECQQHAPEFVKCFLPVIKLAYFDKNGGDPERSDEDLIEEILSHQRCGRECTSEEKACYRDLLDYLCGWNISTIAGLGEFDYEHLRTVKKGNEMVALICHFIRHNGVANFFKLQFELANEMKSDDASRSFSDAFKAKLEATKQIDEVAHVVDQSESGLVDVSSLPNARQQWKEEVPNMRTLTESHDARTTFLQRDVLRIFETYPILAAEPWYNRYSDDILVPLHFFVICGFPPETFHRMRKVYCPKTQDDTRETTKAITLMLQVASSKNAIVPLATVQNIVNWDALSRSDSNLKLDKLSARDVVEELLASGYDPSSTRYFLNKFGKKITGVWFFSSFFTQQPSVESFKVLLPQLVDLSLVIWESFSFEGAAAALTALSQCVCKTKLKTLYVDVPVSETDSENKDMQGLLRSVLENKPESLQRVELSICDMIDNEATTVEKSLKLLRFLSGTLAAVISGNPTWQLAQLVLANFRFDGMAADLLQSFLECDSIRCLYLFYTPEIGISGLPVQEKKDGSFAIDKLILPSDCVGVSHWATFWQRFERLEYIRWECECRELEEAGVLQAAFDQILYLPRLKTLSLGNLFSESAAAESVDLTPFLVNLLRRSPIQTIDINSDCVEDGSCQFTADVNELTEALRGNDTLESLVLRFVKLEGTANVARSFLNAVSPGLGNNGRLKHLKLTDGSNHTKNMTKVLDEPEPKDSYYRFFEKMSRTSPETVQLRHFLSLNRFGRNLLWRDGAEMDDLIQVMLRINNEGSEVKMRFCREIETLPTLSLTKIFKALRRGHFKDRWAQFMRMEAEKVEIKWGLLRGCADLWCPSASESDHSSSDEAV